MKTTHNIAPVKPRRPGRGFTLAELLVVTGIIALSLGIIAPTLHGMFTSRSDRQAEVTMGGLLSAARGAAIESQGYALLHVQIGLDGQCWAGVFRYDGGTGKFIPAEGVRPQSILGNMAFGEVTGRDPGAEPDGNKFQYVSGSSYQESLNDPAGWKGFTTFNVIFASDGSLAVDVDGSAPVLDTSQPIFNPASGKARIWDASAALVNETGVRVMTVFDHKAVKLRSDKAGYIDGVGRFLVINPYTGQLIKSE